jgi:16S rRNA (cytosine967-C5)-methyltransferase
MDAAAAALDAVLPLERPADVALSAFFRTRNKLGGRDRAFVAEAVYGVLRRLRSLEFVAGRRAARPLLMAWLARHGGVNQREVAALLLPTELEQFRAAKAVNLDGESLALRLDLPDWLFERLHAEYGERLPALMEALNRPAPLDLRVNTLKGDRVAVLAQLTADGIRAEAMPYAPQGIRLADKIALQRHPLFVAGAIEVQDEGSQLLSLITGARRGEMVCDFCAGAGGKTLALGAQMHNTGRLYAFDISPKRLANLKPRLARSGLSNVHPQLLTGEHDARIKRLAGKFDRVLVDAPCSGLGTLRRNPDLKWRQSPESVAELTQKQTAILASASRLVKPGGSLVYATCSLLSEENQGIVAAFAETHPEFTQVPVGERLRGHCPALAGAESLQLAPDTQGTDGFFAALWVRR